MKKDDVKKLTKLGENTSYKSYENPNSEILEVFPNKFPARKYTVNYTFTEFTSLCPKTGQPDFATIKIDYIPANWCIETKSLKMYFLAFRNQGAFMETITNQILSDCVDVCNPKWMRVTANFAARGATEVNVIVEHNEEENENEKD